MTFVFFSHTSNLPQQAIVNLRFKCYNLLQYTGEIRAMNQIELLTTSFLSMWRGLIKSIPEILTSVAILVITHYILKFLKPLIEKGLRRFKVREILIEFIIKIFSATLWISAILIAAGILFPTITPGKILTALGLGSIAVGFAFKDIFENFMAGIFILLREPFKIGDIIQVDDIEGKITHITIRDTVITDLDAHKIVIPNAMVFKNKIHVHTSKTYRRVNITCGIAYDEDISAAKECIEKAIKHLPSVLKNQPLQIEAYEFNNSSVDIRVFWHTSSDPAKRRASIDEVVVAIKKALDTAKIEIPYPYRTLVLKDDIGIKMKK
jgi:small conductance mechanosensitive channel